MKVLSIIKALADIQTLDVPIKAKGHLGIWYY